MTRVRGLVGGAAAVLLLAGCGGGGGDTDGTSSTSTSSSASSSDPTSAEPTAAEPTADQSTATGAVVAFVEMSDKLARSPRGDLTQLSQVARGDARKDKMETLTIYRSKGWRSKGSTGLDDVRQTSSRKDEAKVSACIDYADLDVVDGTGESVVADDRQERVLHTYTVVHDAKADEWFVSALEDGGPSC
ncbi:hypothetical protein [Janibacter anophelis]|uniref:hypothetical protein n=1 Tax=Janibacter anophelis TaxID=319054 RepID=UPI00082B3B0F|nr:hypothetical protein [Janibacter anophelis]